MISLQAVDLISHHWKAEHVGLEDSEARRPKTAEAENQRPKQLAANAVLDSSLMMELLE